MLRLSFGIFLALIAIPAIVIGDKVYTKTNAYRDAPAESTTIPVRKIGLITLGVAVFFLLLSTIRVVSPGEVGIPVTFGKTGTPFGAGVHFVNPFAGVETLSVRTENYTMSVASSEGNKNGDDSVSVLGLDGAQGSVDSTALFHLNEGDASRVYKKLGTGFVEKIVRPTIRTCIRDEFAKVPMVVGATSGRDQIGAAITTCIEKVISPEGISLESLQLRDIHLSETVQNSINSKVSAQQTSEQQQFELSKTQQQAEIARVDAQGKADAQQIISCGGTTVPIDDKGNTKVIPNTGASCQNNLSANYLQYLYILTLQKVAEGPNHDTLVLPFDSNLTPLLNITPGPK